MRNPVVNEEGDAGVGDQVRCFLGGRIRRHDDDGSGVERRRGEVGVIHEGDMRKESVTGGEVELDKRGSAWIFGK